MMKNTSIWRVDIIPNWGKRCESTKVREMTHRGIPPSLRGQVWQLMVGREIQVCEHAYRSLLRKAVDRCENVRRREMAFASQQKARQLQRLSEREGLVSENVTLSMEEQGGDCPLPEWELQTEVVPDLPNATGATKQGSADIGYLDTTQGGSRGVTPKRGEPSPLATLGNNETPTPSRSCREPLPELRMCTSSPNTVLLNLTHDGKKGVQGVLPNTSADSSGDCEDTRNCTVTSNAPPPRRRQRSFSADFDSSSSSRSQSAFLRRDIGHGHDIEESTLPGLFPRLSSPPSKEQQHRQQQQQQEILLDGRICTPTLACGENVGDNALHTQRGGRGSPKGFGTMITPQNDDRPSSPKFTPEVASPSDTHKFDTVALIEHDIPRTFPTLGFFHDGSSMLCTCTNSTQLFIALIVIPQAVQ